MKTYTTTEFRAHLAEIINQVHYQKKVVAVGRRNQPDVLVIPFPDGENIPLAEINASAASFDFLAKEPDSYTKAHLIEDDHE